MMDGNEIESRILEWASTRSDLEALIRIGSRSQPGAVVDRWSDWDYHLIVKDRRRYLNSTWPEAIKSCWATHLEITERGVAKVSVLFAGGDEVDFVPLTAWQMKLVYWIMANPAFSLWAPKALLAGIENTKLVVKPGYKILIGGEAWESRLSALVPAWNSRILTGEELQSIVSGFWRHSVWVTKKLVRGEVRAAQRWMAIEVAERRWLMLAEEARLAGLPARPEARQAERWLSRDRLAQTSIHVGPDQATLARALLQEISIIEAVSGQIAEQRNVAFRDHSSVADWIRRELAPWTDRPGA